MDLSGLEMFPDPIVRCSLLRFRRTREQISCLYNPGHFSSVTCLTSAARPRFMILMAHVSETQLLGIRSRVHPRQLWWFLRKTRGLQAAFVKTPLTATHTVCACSYLVCHCRQVVTSCGLATNLDGATLLYQTVSSLVSSNIAWGQLLLTSRLSAISRGPWGVL